MKTDEATGALVPFDFSGIYEEFPSLKRLKVDIEVFTIKPPIDSSNVSIENWVDIARIIRDKYESYDGFVILHGTDTMSYSASALSFMLENLAKPVIFTGSQIPIGILRTDGRENLITAIEIAGARTDDGKPLVPEVALYFQNRLFRGNRTTKFSAEALNAFASFNYHSLIMVSHLSASARSYLTTLLWLSSSQAYVLQHFELCYLRVAHVALCSRPMAQVMHLRRIGLWIWLRRLCHVALLWSIFRSVKMVPCRCISTKQASLCKMLA